MCPPNLKISVYKMAVGPEYATPWCGWASWEDKAGVIQGMNCEAKIRKGALHRIKVMAEDERRT